MASQLPDFARVENGALAGRFLATFWQPVALSKDYGVGKARRIRIFGNHYTLYRGGDGAMRLTQDRCPHRGTSLAYGWVEGDGIRCRYHGWAFDGDGQGREFPSETATYAARICLRTYPVREYLGMVFGFFGEGEPPELFRFVELEDEARGDLLAQAVVLPYNYFQRVENDHDEAHAHYTHTFPDFQPGAHQMPRISARETDYGMISVATRPDGTRMEAHCFMPNILYREVPSPHDHAKMTAHLAYRVPIDDTSTLSFMVNRIGNHSADMRNRLAAAEGHVELSRKLMACEIALEDVDPDHPLLAVIQDTVRLSL